MKDTIKNLYQEYGQTLLEAGEILTLPKLVITNAKTYYGRVRAYSKTNIFIDIRISARSFKQECIIIGEEAAIENLKDTICHELAHLRIWSHDQEHTDLTEYFKQITNNPIAIASKSPTKLSDLVEDPKKARRLLRKAGIEKPGTRWEWLGEVPEEVKRILSI